MTPVDYRQKELRRDGFMKYFAWEILYNDADPAIWLCNYINNKFQHDIETRLWFAWLYGTTYHAPAAYVILNSFKDFHNINIREMIDWNNQNYKRLRYQTDTKYNKGHLPQMYASYRKFTDGRKQLKTFESLYADNEEQTFNVLWTALNFNLYKFGRMMTWIYMQQLKHTCGIPVNPTSLFLRDYAGSRHHRNGLLYALGMDDWIDERLSERQYAMLEYKAQEIIHETRAAYPDHAHKCDLFLLETCLCGYKKMYRTNDSRYLGYSLDRQAEEIIQCENDGWQSIDWNVLWTARDDILDARLARNKRILKEWYTLYFEQGIIMRADWL